MKKRNCKRRNRGDSLGETLVALLIIALGMTMLAGAILSSARLNKKAAEAQSLPDALTEQSQTVNVTVTWEDAPDGERSSPYARNATIDERGFVYYE